MIRIEPKNIEAVQRELRRLAQKSEDFTPLMAKIAETLRTLTEEALEHERAPDGTPWPDLAPATWSRKTKNRMLYEEGRLSDIEAASSATEAAVGVNATARGFTYPIVHQFGSKQVPARPFLPIDEDGEMYAEVVEEIVELIVKYLES